MQSCNKPTTQSKQSAIPAVCCTRPGYGYCSTAAYEKPYAKIVFGVINAIEKEEFQREEQEHKERMVKEDKRKANKEAELLGLEDYDAHARPNGPAPDGKTWSFALGKWQDEDYLRSAKKAKYNGD